jgi:predicted GIY-YIG superfamily endonuclease
MTHDDTTDDDTIYCGCIQMHQKFAALVKKLHPSLKRLLECQPISDGIHPTHMPKGKKTRGVYLFTESEGDHLYIGRSNNLLRRYKNHWMPHTTYHQASFAILLARETTGRMKATYKAGDGSRKALAADPAFAAAKERIRAMNYRWVEESDPHTQCLLEFYAAISLAARYNDFDTH